MQSKNTNIHFEIIGEMTPTKIDEFNFGYHYENELKIYAR